MSNYLSGMRMRRSSRNLPDQRSYLRQKVDRLWFPRSGERSYAQRAAVPLFNGATSMKYLRFTLSALLTLAFCSAARSQTTDRVTAETDPAAAGGGAFADFDSLIALIESIVAPETWETLGGPSSMQPYPQGVYVHASGTLQKCRWVTRDDAVEELKAMLDSSGDGLSENLADWRRPADLRFVSLRRLYDLRSDYGKRNVPIPAAMFFTAGLSRVQHVFRTDDDIIIAGPVAGIEVHQGWYRQRGTGRVPIRLDFLIACLDSALSDQPFGCTIDPTADGLQAAAQVAARIQNHTEPLGTAANSLASALGMQRIEVFGTAGDTPLGYVMVEADRHMKQLALGIEPLPRNAKTYLDVLDEMIEQGPPNDLLLRLWFTANPRAVRMSVDRTVFQLGGSPIRLSGQNERALANGQRGPITRDPRTEAFVHDFNEHFAAIRSAYPIYAALESIYQAASLAELVDRYTESPSDRELLKSLASLQSSSQFLMPTPRQVESIAVLHIASAGRKRHHVLIASGGVAVKSEQTLSSKLAEYPPLESLAKPDQARPPVIQRWWWDRK